MVVLINIPTIGQFKLVTMPDTKSSSTNLINVIFYFLFPIFVLVYSIYRYKSAHPSSSARTQRNSTSRSPDSIPDVKERMRLFNERKAALIARARDTYLKKHADASKRLIE